MIGRASFAIFCALGAAWPATGWSKDFHLAPTSRWVMEYAPGSCRLTRTFGTGDDQIIAQFIRHAPSASFDFNLIGKPLSTIHNKPTVRVRFGPVGDFVESGATAGSAGNLPAVFLTGRLDNLDRHELGYRDLAKLSPADLRRLNSIEPATEAAVTTVTVRIWNRTIRLNLGPMGPPMAEMRKCTVRLVEEWGLNPAEQEALLSPPKPRTNPGGWLHPSDYPGESGGAGEQAMVNFRLMVDAAGRVTSCAVQTSIAKEHFGELSCRLLKRRASFEPARTADGAAEPSYYVGRVLWMIE